MVVPLLKSSFEVNLVVVGTVVLLVSLVVLKVSEAANVVLLLIPNVEV